MNEYDALRARIRVIRAKLLTLNVFDESFKIDMISILSTLGKQIDIRQVEEQLIDDLIEQVDEIEDSIAVKNSW